MGFWGMALGAAVWMACPNVAQADEPPREGPELPKWRSTYDPDSIEAYAFGLQGSGLMVAVDAYELGVAPSADEPMPLVGRNLRLHGNGWAAGGSFKGMIQNDVGVRLGLEIGLYRIQELGLVHDGLDPGVSISLDEVWMTNFGFTFGKAFDAVYFYPYIEARTSLNILRTDIDLEIDGHGHVGSTPYDVVSVTVAPRLGAFVPFDGDLYLDVSAQYGLFGVERFGGFVGFGVWSD